MEKRLGNLEPVHCQLKELLLSYDKDSNEVAEVHRVAGRMAAILRGCFWTRYSDFTALFATCHTEAQLNDAIAEWNIWLEDMHLVDSLTGTVSDTK